MESLITDSLDWPRRTGTITHPIRQLWLGNLPIVDSSSAGRSRGHICLCFAGLRSRAQLPQHAFRLRLCCTDKDHSAPSLERLYLNRTLRMLPLAASSQHAVRNWPFSAAESFSLAVERRYVELSACHACRPQTASYHS